MRQGDASAAKRTREGNIVLELRYVADNKDLILAMIRDRGDDPARVFAEADPWDLD